MLRATRLKHADHAAVSVQSRAVRAPPSMSQVYLQSQPARNQTQFSRHFSYSPERSPENAQEQPIPRQQPLHGVRPKPRKQKAGVWVPSNIAPEQLGRLREATSDGSSITLSFENRTGHFPHMWFRDSCSCSHCVSESSGQKKFATCDIDNTPQLESCRILEDDSLELVWAHDFMRGDSHTSTYPLLFLQRWLTYPVLPEPYIPERLLWDRTVFEKDMEARNISYDDWMAGGDSFAKCLLDLFQWGLVLIKGVPETKEAVKDIANKIGVLQSTFYGETWDVISKPNAENVAYTNEFLCLHQDLMYDECPPHVQLLHCLNNDCEGGDSLFSDGIRTATEFKFQRPRQYALLAQKKINFQYSRNGHTYHQFRSVVTDRIYNDPTRGLPAAIRWSPPFQGPFSSRSRLDILPAWRDAAKAFRDNLEAHENMLQYRMQPGDCVLFDNWRILHGRTKFDTSSGHRHLHGAYLRKDTVLSALHREINQGRISLEARLGEPAEVVKATMRYGSAAGNVEIKQG